MTPEESAFLRAICLRPDDDTPRLMYADWLEDRGDPRGEFIRVQIGLVKLVAEKPNSGLDLNTQPSYSQWLSDFRMMLGRERDLLSVHGKVWLDPAPAGYHAFINHPYPFNPKHTYFNHPHEYGWSPDYGPATANECFIATFRQGFVAAVQCSQALWLSHGSAIVALHPVQVVSLIDARLREQEVWNEVETSTEYVWDLNEPDEFGFRGAVEYLVNSHQQKQLRHIAYHGRLTNLVYCETPAVRESMISQTCVLHARLKAGLSLLCETCQGRGEVWTDRVAPCPDCQALPGPMTYNTPRGLGWRVADR